MRQSTINAKVSLLQCTPTNHIHDFRPYQQCEYIKSDKVEIILVLHQIPNLHLTDRTKYWFQPLHNVFLLSLTLANQNLFEFCSLFLYELNSHTVFLSHLTDIFIYLQIFIHFMRQIELKKGNFTMTAEIEGFLERTVTKFGTSAKIDCPKRFLGQRVYVLICKTNSTRAGDVE